MARKRLPEDKQPNRITEKRKEKRRTFGYYMPVFDERGDEVVGHLSDVSQTGFRIDSREAILTDKLFRLRLNLTPEVSDKEFITFVARSVWCQHDRFDIWTHNVGFNIVEIDPEDAEIYRIIVDKYGSSEKRSLF